MKLFDLDAVFQKHFSYVTIMHQHAHGMGHLWVGLGVEMSIYWEFPWVPWVPWDSRGNGNRQASFMVMEIRMGMA